jgi:hypothetical protein
MRQVREKRDKIFDESFSCVSSQHSPLKSNALNITSNSFQVQKRLDDSHRVLIVTIFSRRMKTAAALRKEEADEEKRRQRKTQNERKTRNTRTIQIFYFLRDGCRDDTIIITTNLVRIFRLERVEINLLGFFLLLFQVKLFVGHDSFYMMRVIFCRLYQKRVEREKKELSF